MSENTVSSYDWFLTERIALCDKKPFKCMCGHGCFEFHSRHPYVEHSRHGYRYVDITNKSIDYCGSCGRNLELQGMASSLKGRVASQKREMNVKLNFLKNQLKDTLKAIEDGKNS